jgi:hypothetical protein
VEKNPSEGPFLQCSGTKTPMLEKGSSYPKISILKYF